MKRIGLLLVGLLFAAVVLGISLFRESRMETSTTKTEMFADVEYSSPSANLETYILPYPGILPDNPLYVLKMARDRTRVWMVRNNEQRFEMLLGMSDKRVGAAYYLAVGNKVSLAYSTLLKAKSYMDQTIQLVELEQMEEEQEKWQVLEKAVTAHRELVEKMMLMVEGDSRVKFELVFKEYEALLLRIRAQQPMEVEEPVLLETDSSDEGRL